MSELSAALAARLDWLLSRHWWRPRPSALSRLLQPLAVLYALLAAAARRRAVPQRLPVPVLVVGNLVVGGAGKTPTVIALVQAFAAAGRCPGVIARGYGRHGDGVREVHPDDDATASGDEALLVRRRTGVPVWVGRDRVAAGRALCAAHPEVDLLLSDDGLQHHALARDAALVVFDERGAGNGLLLPAGPLREALPRLVPTGSPPPVLYTHGAPSTVLPGAIALRHLGRAWPLAAWHAGDATGAVELAALRGRPLWAAAGLAAPEKFFTMLETVGLDIRRLPLPDHHRYAQLPWPADAADVVLTEKDAVKIAPARCGATRVWVLPLDLTLPDALVGELLALLPRR